MVDKESKFYAVFVVELETKFSTLVLCNGYVQLQTFLDNLDEEKVKITAIEVDDVCALSELNGFEEFKEPPDEPEDDTTNFPQCYLN